MADLYVHIPGVSVFLLQEDEPAPVMQCIDDMLEGVQSDGFLASPKASSSQSHELSFRCFSSFDQESNKSSSYCSSCFNREDNIYFASICEYKMVSQAAFCVLTVAEDSPIALL
jgi:hypothetical protein